MRNHAHHNVVPTHSRIALAALVLSSTTAAVGAEAINFRVFSPFKANASFVSDFDIPFATTYYAARGGSLNRRLVSNDGVVPVTDERYQIFPGSNPPFGLSKYKSSAWGPNGIVTLALDPASIPDEVAPTSVGAITPDGRFIAGSVRLPSSSFAARWNTVTGALSTLKTVNGATVRNSDLPGLDQFGTMYGSAQFVGIGTRPVIWPVDSDARMLATPANIRQAGVGSGNRFGVFGGGYALESQLNQTLPIRWNSDESFTQLSIPANLLGATNFFAGGVSSISDSGFMIANTFYVRPGTSSDFRSDGIRWTPGSTVGQQLLGFAVADQTSVGGLLEDGTVMGGVFTSSAQSLAVRWAPDSVTPTLMGTLGGNSFISGINSLGYAVGTSNNRAVLWNPDGSIVDLNTLLSLPAGVVLQDAYSISDTGWIAGHTAPASPPANNFTIGSPIFALQIPTIIPEPSLHGLVVVPLTLLARRR